MNREKLREIILRAEEDDNLWPQESGTGLRAAAGRLDRVESILFSLENPPEELIDVLLDVEKESPLFPRAKRLRLLFKNGKSVREALPKTNPFSEKLFSALAAGPGPTAAKQAFAQAVTDRAHVHAVSGLTLALAGKARPVFRAEKAWLRQVGPDHDTRRFEPLPWRLLLGLKENFVSVVLIFCIVIVLGLIAGGLISACNEPPETPPVAASRPAVVSRESVPSGLYVPPVDPHIGKSLENLGPAHPEPQKASSPDAPSGRSLPHGSGTFGEGKASRKDGDIAGRVGGVILMACFAASLFRRAKK